KTNDKINEIVVSITDYHDLVINNNWSIAINKAIDDVFINGGGKVLIPSGSYDYDGDIHFKTGVFVTGVGENSILNAIGNSKNRFIIYNKSRLSDFNVNVNINYNDDFYYF